MRLSGPDLKTIIKCLNYDESITYGDFVNFASYEPEQSDDSSRGSLGRLQSDIVGMLERNPPGAASRSRGDQVGNATPRTVSLPFQERDPDREGGVSTSIFRRIISEDLALDLSPSEAQDVVQRFDIAGK